MNQEQHSGNRAVKGLAIAMLACRALATSGEVFLHRPNSFGERYFGLQALIAVSLLLFWPVLWPLQDPRAINLLLALFLAMWVSIRIATSMRRLREGPEPHTRYGGTPLMTRLLPNIHEQKIKGFLEPTLVFLVGILLLWLNKPLGSYLMLAGFGLFMTANLTAQSERRRALDLHDAYIAQHAVAERFRNLRG